MCSMNVFNFDNVTIFFLNWSENLYFPFDEAFFLFLQNRNVLFLLLEIKYNFWMFIIWKELREIMIFVR